MAHPPCISCDSTTFTHFLRTHDRHYGVPGEFNLARCSGCGLVRLDPMPTKEELSNFYADDYYAYKPLRVDPWFKRIAKRVLCIKINTHNPKFQNPGRFLDIGCGSGDYMQVMQAKGWKVCGVEPSAFGSGQGQSAGLDIFHGTLLAAKFQSNSFDYIRSNHSFEHMPNPVEVLNEIFRILKPQGKLFIGIPNMGSLPYRIFGRYWWYLGAPLHTYTYNVSNISMLLRRSGFSIDKVYFHSNYASLLGSLQIYLNRKNRRNSSEGKLIRNPLLMLISNIAMWVVDRIGQGDAIEVIATKPQ